MRRDDLREERARRLEVVVVPMDAGRGEPFGLDAREDAGGHGHVEARALAYERCETHELVHHDRVRSAHRQHDAELTGPECRRLLCGLEYLVGVEERCRLHRAVELGRLRAEVAILRATARLGRQDAFDLYL